MVYTNHRLSILDDEAIIASSANNTVRHTMDSFLHRNGQHEHPPLSDLFLHGWLLLTHRSLSWLRVFANIFFIAGLLVLAKCGELLGNRRTSWAILLLGILWPFGYFYARIAGWYCFCFLTVSILLYCYFRLLRSAEPNRWAAFAGSSILLVWSNYFGIAILLLLLADLVVLHREIVRKNLWTLLIVCSSIVVSFLPLLRALMFDADGTVKPEALSWTTSIVKIGFMLFATMASVSVAPWFLPWSIPCGLAILCLFLFLLLNAASRRPTIHFLLLILGLALTNHLDLKRLLFLTPWLLLAIALSVSTTAVRSRFATLLAITVVFSIGWIGIVTQAHLAISNFYEPWQAVAKSAVANLGPKDAIVSDSGLFFFYLDSSLSDGKVPDSIPIGSPAYRQRYNASVFLAKLPQDASASSFSRITTVSGANPVEDVRKRTEQTIDELTRACRLIDSQRFAPDPAAAYKEIFDPAAPNLNYRINVAHFDCSASHS
jgi:hypothetical protein